MSSPEPVLQVRNVDKSFRTPGGSVDVLRGVNLTVAPGEFLMITGPSGSGKSTLLNLVAMLDKPTSGQILFRGRNVSEIDDAGLCEIRKREIGMVFQKFCLLPHRSALDNVLFRFRYVDHQSPDIATTQARNVLEEMGLGSIGSRLARLLSAGEMQRVAIARAMVLRPALLVADEPTGNLDSTSAGTVMKCFQNLNRQGLTIIMVTHNQNLLEFSTRHKVCRDGRIE
jgi:putative ABC transport system ATP-binding protein